jgi:hypothetical protein
MADEKKEETVEVELLADGIRLDGVDYVRGDLVTLPKGHAERLAKHGSVGKKGTIEARRKAEADLVEAEARRQATLSGLDISEPFVEEGSDVKADKAEAEAAPARGRR